MYGGAVLTAGGVSGLWIFDDDRSTAELAADNDDQTNAMGPGLQMMNIPLDFSIRSNATSPTPKTWVSSV